MAFENVRVGVWIDYTTNSTLPRLLSLHHWLTRGSRLQILATDFGANVMKTLVAIALTLSTKYMTQILRH